MTPGRWAVAGLLFAACGSRTGIELDLSGVDASVAPRREASANDDATHVDAGSDATARDAGHDAAPPPSLEAGAACADGGFPVAYVLDQSGVFYTFDPGTLSTTRVGAPQCPTDAPVWDFTVSREGNAYVFFEDSSLYEVDLRSPSLSCTPTAFVSGQLGLSALITSTVIPTSTGEQMLFYGVPPSDEQPLLARSDLTSFVLSEIGPVDLVAPGSTSVLDIKADALGRLFGLTSSGLFDQIDPATGTVITSFQTAFSSGDWALLTFAQQIYFFGGTNVFRFDLASKALTVLGTVGPTVIGASAVPCLHAP